MTTGSGRRTKPACPARKTRPDVAARVLVAGIGNLFLGDDGFGPEVVRRLAAEGSLPAGVRVADYGIRGMHLAYDLLDPCDALVLVDALPGAGSPGEIVVLEVTKDDLGDGEFDAHGMNPAAMLAGLDRLGGSLPATYVVGCRVSGVAEAIGLSEPVAAAVPAAIVTIRGLLARLTADAPAGSRRF
jgi:hydrogenase maturation protease